MLYLSGAQQGFLGSLVVTKSAEIQYFIIQALSSAEIAHACCKRHDKVLILSALVLKKPACVLLSKSMLKAQVFVFWYVLRNSPKTTEILFCYFNLNHGTSFNTISLNTVKKLA